ncbi:MAG: hypothetical protein AAF984_06815, partial [Verrucomicrobiota bacterium]
LDLCEILQLSINSAESNFKTSATWPPPSPQIELEINEPLPLIKGDKKILVSAFDWLIQAIANTASMMSKDYVQTIRLETKAQNNDKMHPGINLIIKTNEQRWTAQGISELFNFMTKTEVHTSVHLIESLLIIYHHSGEFLIHDDPPLGPSFQIWLPLDPEEIPAKDLGKSYGFDSIFRQIEDTALGT